MASEEPGQWYWCLRHQRAESTQRCKADVLMGPYGSAQEAAQYSEKAAARNEAWDAEDERWEGG